MSPFAIGLSALTLSLNPGSLPSTSLDALDVDLAPELPLAIPVTELPDGTVFLDDAQAWNLRLCVGSSCLKYDSKQGFSTT